MNLAHHAGPRPRRPPLPVYRCWAVSVLLGALVLGRHILDRPAAPSGLLPASLAAHLADLVPAGATAVRVNGLYGSGHAGVWQFAAHLTWHTPAGQVTGGATNLPILAGHSPLAPEFDPTRLAAEERIGWTLAQLDHALHSAPDANAPLALVELEISADGAATFTTCRSPLAGSAQCTRADRQGTVNFLDAVTDDPLLQALSVQRAGHPVS